MAEDAPAQVAEEKSEQEPRATNGTLSIDVKV